MSDEVNEQRFLNILKDDWLVDQDIIRQIEDEVDSPLTYASRTITRQILEENDLGHSCRVLINCRDIIKNSELSLSNTDKLVLSYASLLHDIAKSLNNIIKNEIEVAVLKQCELFAHENADHGIRAAHYIEEKCRLRKRNERIKLYALREVDAKELLRIIAFHSTGRIHPCFMRSGKISRKSLLLCLIFWVADIADAYSLRVEGSASVAEKYQDIVTQVRKRIKEVKIFKNSILWEVDKTTTRVKDAVSWENNKLAQHRVLLQAFNIPDHIESVISPKKRTYRNRKTYLKYNDISKASLCFDVSSRYTPLALSANTLPELYERIIEAFYQISIADELMPKHYFGPTVLEVRNVEKDRRKEINTRSENKDFGKLKEYTETWLKHSKDASDKFYFGYTHGQRINEYLHIKEKPDLDKALEYADEPDFEDKERLKDFFKNWHGKISQLENVIKILKKERAKARRAYVVIPHIVVDNPKSDFYVPEEVAPALIAIQFMIERGPKLSGFALLRAQELSTFFVVNYLEVRGLLEKLQEKLRKKFPRIGLGRIVMLSAFGYFQPNTVLLDKPQICRLTDTDVQGYARKMADRGERRKFIGLVGEFEKDFIKIETQWCGKFARYFSQEGHSGASEKMKILERSLNRLERRRKKGGYSATYSRDDKKKAIEKFIRSIRGMSW